MDGSERNQSNIARSVVINDCPGKTLNSTQYTKTHYMILCLHVIAIIKSPIIRKTAIQTTNLSVIQSKIKFLYCLFEYKTHM
jgi:hypothetical protein